MSATDADLLRRMQLGDGDAFRDLYQRHHARVYRFALMYSGADGPAADITQDVFMQLLDNTRFDPSRGELGAYLLGMARNLLRRHRRDTQRFEALDDEDEVPLPDPLVDRHEPSILVGLAQQHGALRAAILDLPAHYREVLILCELEELPYQETADALGIPVGTVRSRLNRARGLLGQALGAQPPAPVTPVALGESYALRTV